MPKAMMTLDRKQWRGQNKEQEAEDERTNACWSLILILPHIGLSRRKSPGKSPANTRHHRKKFTFLQGSDQ